MAPDFQHGDLKDKAQSYRGHEAGEDIRARLSKDYSFGGAADERDDRYRNSHPDPEIQAPELIDLINHIGTDHVELTMREVRHFHDPEGHGETHRDERVDRGRLNRIQQGLDEGI